MRRRRSEGVDMTFQRLEHGSVLKLRGKRFKSTYLSLQSREAGKE